jgi:hypothetical protein
MVLIHPVLYELLINEEYRHEDWRHHAFALVTALKALLLWPILLFLPAACTTCFTLASRRATLPQIQGSLADTSAQLRALAESSRPAETTRPSPPARRAPSTTRASSATAAPPAPQS